MHITRKQATKLIEEVRSYVAADPEARHYLADKLALLGIPALTKCEGEAHSNAYIDHCSLCMPRWGLVGESVVVR